MGPPPPSYTSSQQAAIELQPLPTPSTTLRALEDNQTDEHDDHYSCSDAYCRAGSGFKLSFFLSLLLLICGLGLHYSHRNYVDTKLWSTKDGNEQLDWKGVLKASQPTDGLWGALLMFSCLTIWLMDIVYYWGFSVARTRDTWGLRLILYPVVLIVWSAMAYGFFLIMPLHNQISHSYATKLP